MAPCPFTSWQIDRETVETVADFILGSSKITAGGDCSHEIKIHLLLGRKIMTNLDSILKSRDITLSTKVHLVKAVVFPVVMCGCEKWSEVKSLSRVWLFATPGTVAYQAPYPWDFPGKSTGVGCHFLLQGIFPTQESNPGLRHCRQTLYHLSHQVGL